MSATTGLLKQIAERARNIKYTRVGTVSPDVLARIRKPDAMASLRLTTAEALRRADSHDGTQMALDRLRARLRTGRTTSLHGEAIQ